MDIQKKLERGLEMLRNTEHMSDEEKEQQIQKIVTEWLEIETNIHDIGVDNLLAELKKCDLDSIRVRVYVWSWLHHMTSDSAYIERLLEDVAGSDLANEEVYFIICQIQYLYFSNPDYELTDRVEDLLDDLYKRVVDSYVEEVSDELVWIPAADRNKDFILVLTGQFLTIQHGPTKTTLDRCKILMEDMEKDVFLINTGTTVPWNHLVLMRNTGRGNYMDQYRNAEQINYESLSIPYIQMENSLPTYDQVRGMINLIRENRPYQIVTIGVSFYEELFDRMIPVLNISLAPSKLSRTFVSYQQIGRPINDYDRRFLRHRGLTENHIISDVFTSRLAPQTAVKSREELQLPTEGQIAVSVGDRLATEITEEYIDMIRPCLENGLYLLLLGNVDRIIPVLKEKLEKAFSQVICPGRVNDPLAYLDHCFLYINPLRMGGGTSCVEAMSKSVPVVTIAYGDVYINTGEEFGVPDYESMQREILKHMDDAEYHREKAESAKRRAELMLDSSAAFVRIMDEYEKRMLAKEEMGEL